MNENYEKLMKCFECVQQKITFKPEIALILGSGLGDYADTMEVVETLDYHDIEGFPVSTVPGHKGRFVFGYAGGVPIVAMQGRVHFYEGYKPQDVVLPIRLMKLMGAKVLFLTNAAGGINRSFNAGDFMLITDQISMSVPSPLIGENIDELGVRFPDMSEVYSRRLRKIIENSAVTAGVPLRRGVYIQTTGPQYETPAETRIRAPWRRRGGNVHRHRSDSGAPRGNGDMRNLLHKQPRGGDIGESAHPRGGTGDRRQSCPAFQEAGYSGD